MDKRGSDLGKYPRSTTTKTSLDVRLDRVVNLDDNYLKKGDRGATNRLSTEEALPVVKFIVPKINSKF